MERPPLIVVEDAADCSTIIQHHLLGVLVGLDDVGLPGLAWGLAKQGLLRWPPFGYHLAFDRPQSPNLAPHLHLGAAVGVEDGLGHILILLITDSVDLARHHSSSQKP